MNNDENNVALTPAMLFALEQFKNSLSALQDVGLIQDNEIELNDENYRLKKVKKEVDSLMQKA